MEKYNNVKAFLFFLVILAFVVGGFILMKKSTFKPAGDKIVELNKEEEKDIRIDNTKDYIYFTNKEKITHELDIEFQDVNLNFKDSNNIAKKLNEESAELKKTLVYDEDNEEAVYDHLVSAKYMIYSTYAYDNYISLVVDYYSYELETLVNYLDTKTYVFDKKSGKLLTSDELLEAYDLKKEEVLNNIKNHIADEDIAKEGEELDVDATIENINEFNLFIDKIGRLSMSILVKSDQKDYNEIIILN